VSHKKGFKWFQILSSPHFLSPAFAHFATSSHNIAQKPLFGKV
jgi:hypothetical protein